MTITPLFVVEDEDEEEYNENDEQATPAKAKFDKIFNNDFNTGNLDYEEFGPPKVDQEYIDSYMESCYDSSEYYAKMQIMEKIDKTFKETDLGKTIGLKRKIPKQILPDIYLSVRDIFVPKELTEVEYFTNLAEYFGMSYEILYDNIPAIHRENIVKELDNKFGVLSRRGIRKLF